MGKTNVYNVFLKPPGLASAIKAFPAVGVQPDVQDRVAYLSKSK